MIINLTRNTKLAAMYKIAQDPWARMKGLLGTEALPTGSALVITHCNSIHMFFMKYSIDVIFCDKANKVVGLCQEIKPYNLSPIFFQATYAIELPAGTILSTNTQLGDQIQL